MFESLYPAQRGHAERAVPLIIGVLVALPLEVVAHWVPPLERMGAFAELVYEWAGWIYFPDLVLVVLDDDFREKPIVTVIRVAVTVAFYAAIVWWCRYWIEEGYIEGKVNERLWKHWPFRIGMGVFVPFFALRIWYFVSHWQRSHMIPHDEEAFGLGFFMYLGGMTALLSAIIVIGRRIRARRVLGHAAGI